MTGAANRRRGADAERRVTAWLRTNGYPDARRTFAGDGQQLGDVEFHPNICLEVKDVAKSAWPSWRLQALTESQGRIPVVVRRTRGVPDVGLWEAHVDFGLCDGNADPHEWAEVWCPRTRQLWHAARFEAVIESIQLDAHDFPDLTLTERTT